MNSCFRAHAALGMIFAVAMFAIPASSTPLRELGHKAPYHQADDFTKASALARPAPTASAARGIDGLGRNDEECNFGCVDH